MQRISHDTFTTLMPEAILLLTESPDTIASRRKNRDGRDVSVESIKAFQDEEISYAKEVTTEIGAKLFISKGADDLTSAIDFIKSRVVSSSL